MTGKQKYGGNGLSAAGVKSYEKLHNSLKKTDFRSDEWVGLWKHLWEKEEGSYIKPRRAVASTTWEAADGTSEGEGEALFDGGDEVFEPEEAGGWVMGG